MNPENSEVSESETKRNEAIGFGRHLFAESTFSEPDSGLKNLRVFIFAAADTECPLSYFRKTSLAEKDNAGVIGEIIGESVTSVRNHLIELCCGNMGIVWKDKAARTYRINTTKPNASEWRLLVDFRLALETEWIKGMYQDEGGIEKLKEANKEMRRAREDIMELRDSIVGKWSHEQLAKQRNRVHSFLSWDTTFHLVGVRNNAVAVSYLEVLLDRLQLDFTMSQRIKARIVGDETERIGSFFEHEDIIAMLESKHADEDAIRQKLKEHIEAREL